MVMRWAVSRFLSYFISRSSASHSAAHSKYDINKPEPNSKLYGYLRIASNLVAIAVILLSVITMVVLLNQGMFRRKIAQWGYQDEPGYWRSFGATCLLSSTGFVKNSCSAMELNIMASSAAWDTIGIKLAEILQVPSTKNYKVTTCIVGCIEGKTWATLELVIGYDTFPLCNPLNGSQAVAGMAMVEGTSSAENYTSGAYLMTVFADATMNQSVIHENTDGTHASVIDNVSRTVIGIDGSSSHYESGINTLINSYPLTSRYAVKSYCISQIIDIESTLSGQPGWSTGLYSKKSITTGWVCGHDVNNATELIALQAVLTILTLAAISGDLLITFKGLRGIVSNKPVLTYDILSALEQRKMILVFGTLSAAPSLLFVDVARLYLGTINGLRIWVLSIISLGIFFAFASFFLITIMQYIPSPRALRWRLVPLSAALFFYSSIPLIAFNVNDLYESLCFAFYNTQGILFMNVNGRICSCGAYISTPAKTAASELLPLILWSLLACFSGSVFCAIMKNFFLRRKWLMDIEWIEKNSFMTSCHTPRWLSSLPLDQDDAIKMGNRLFCKPSMQARMGYATVVRGKNHHQVIAATTDKAKDVASDNTFYLVDIYGLIPAIIPASWRWVAPSIHCAIADYTLTHPTSKSLNKNVSYKHDTGTCVG